MISDDSTSESKSESKKASNDDTNNRREPYDENEADYDRLSQRSHSKSPTKSCSDASSSPKEKHYYVELLKRIRQRRLNETTTATATIATSTQRPDEQQQERQMGNPNDVTTEQIPTHDEVSSYSSRVSSSSPYMDIDANPATTDPYVRRPMDDAGRSSDSIIAWGMYT